MKWIKKYEAYSTPNKDTPVKYEDVSYNPFYYYSNGDDGYHKGQSILKEKVRDTILKYNNLFKHLGIRISLPEKKATSENHSSLWINITLNFLQVQLPAESDQTRTIFYNALYYASPENDKVITSVSPMVKSTDITGVSEITDIKFDFEHKFNNDIGVEKKTKDDFSSFKSQREGRKIQDVKYSINRDLTTEDNFMDKIMPQLFSFITQHMLDKVLMYYAGMGNKKVEIELPFIKNTIVRCLSKWKNLTIDSIGKIAFEEISNSKDNHKIFNFMKSRQDTDNLVARQVHKNWGKEPGVDWYDLFQKQDKQGLDKSSDMVDMGFAD